MITVQVSPWVGWPAPGAVIQLEDDAAVALFSAIAAYRADTGRHDADVAPLFAPVGGLRTVAECAEMAEAFDIYKGRKAGSMAWALATYAKYNMLKSSDARPSTSSPHVSGRAADIAPPAFYDWMLTHGHEYGWRFTLLNAGDPRHAEFFPNTATAALNVTSLTGSTAPAAPPTQQEEGEEIMKPILMSVNDSHGNYWGSVYAAGDLSKGWFFQDPSTVNTLGSNNAIKGLSMGPAGFNDFLKTLGMPPVNVP